MKKIFVIFFFYKTCSCVQAQEGEVKHALDKGYNPEYRINYFDKMIFQVDLNSDIDNFLIPKLNNTTNEQSSFAPNNIFKIKFSFDYKFLGLYFSVSPDFLPGNNVDPKKGETKTIDFSFKFFYSDQLRQEVVFKKIKGFYLEDPNSDQPIEIFKDLEINTIGGRTFFILNKNFSYRAFESLTERQIKSNGSIIPTISYYFNNLHTNKQDNLTSYLAHIKSFDAFVQIGYMYNFVIYKKWFSTLGVHPGIGLNKSNNYYLDPSNQEESKVSSFSVNYNLDANIAIGYNNKNFFSGLKGQYKNFDYSNNNNAEIINSKISFGIFTGYRFNESRPVKKVFQYVEQRLGL